MAPNLSSNPLSCREKAEFIQQSRTKVPASGIETEKVVSHVFCYLVGDEFLIELPTLDKNEKNVVEAFKKLTDELKDFSGDDLREMISSLNYTPETTDEVFEGVSNELFCEGITWSRILTYTVFASELAIQCLEKEQPKYALDAIFGCYMRIFKELLEKWILDHGGWGAFIEFSNAQKSVSNRKEIDVEQKPDHFPSRTSCSWAKSAFHNTVRVLGTLAYFANITNATDSFNLNKS